MRKPASSILSLLTLTGMAAFLLAPGGASAAPCKKGFVKNQGLCVKKPPAGVPAPGYYSFASNGVTGGLEVRYETRGTFRNKFIILGSFKAKVGPESCTGAGKPGSAKAKTDRVPIVARKFAAKGFFRTEGVTYDVQARFVGTKRIAFKTTLSYGTAPDSCTQTNSGETTLRPSTKQAVR